MKVILAGAYGMCFGVRDALAAAERVESPQSTTIYGELVHNPAVLERLARRGFQQMGEREREVPATEHVLITAHGVSGRERGRLVAAGLSLIDTTCPLVRHAHATARTLDAEGRLVVVVGDANHVEVRGIVGDLNRYIVAAGPADVAEVQDSRLGVVAQTTTPVEIFDSVIAELRRLNPEADIRIVSTICAPTRERQQSLAELLDRVQVLVVVGGRRSRNSQQLVAKSERAGIRAVLVESAADLRAEWFCGIDAVGVTAGTSTLEETVQSVVAALEAIATTPV
jgi:4-hydroxy-3-methylbut-2-enyl diphosphate reductase